MEVRVRSALLLTLLAARDGCGGCVAKVDQGVTDGAPAVDADSGATEPVGQGTKYPSPLPGSASFFWRWGLGNWFVTKSDGVHRDASLDVVDGARAYKASGDGQGVSVALWAQLNHPLGAPVDLSPYSGISFDARLTTMDVPLTVAFNARANMTAAVAASKLT